VTILSIVAYGVVNLHTNPARDGHVLPHLLSQLLDSKGLWMSTFSILTSTKNVYKPLKGK